MAVAEFAKIREVRGREMGKRILGKGIRVSGQWSVGSCRNPLIFPLIFHIIFTEEFGVRCDYRKQRTKNKERRTTNDERSTKHEERTPLLRSSVVASVVWDSLARNSLAYPSDV